jgi:hypothetical protein
MPFLLGDFLVLALVLVTVVVVALIVGNGAPSRLDTPPPAHCSSVPRDPRVDQPPGSSC